MRSLRRECNGSSSMVSPSASTTSVRRAGAPAVCLSLILLVLATGLTGCGNSQQQITASTTPTATAPVTGGQNGAQTIIVTQTTSVPNSGSTLASGSVEIATERGVVADGSGAVSGSVALVAPNSPAGSGTGSVSPSGPSPSVAGQSPARINLRGVEGVVIDMDSGEPIAGARVSFGDTEVWSGPDGSFLLIAPLTTEDSITANKEGYIGARRRVRSGTSADYGTCRLELVSLDSDKAPPPAPGN